MHGYLLGTTTIAGRTYTYDDVDGIVSTGFGADYYGGRVRSFGKTKDGFLLCVERDTVIDIFVDEEQLTNEGLKKLAVHFGKEVEEQNYEETDIEKMTRPQLLSLAKKMNVPGKIMTFKTDELIALLKEAIVKEKE